MYTRRRLLIVVGTVAYAPWALFSQTKKPALADEIAAYRPALIVAVIVPTARAVAKVAPADHAPAARRGHRTDRFAISRAPG